VNSSKLLFKNLQLFYCSLILQQRQLFHFDYPLMLNSYIKLTVHFLQITLQFSHNYNPNVKIIIVVLFG